MKAVVALGSNLENRKLNLDIAITHLEVLLKDLILKLNQLAVQPKMIL